MAKMKRATLKELADRLDALATALYETSGQLEKQQQELGVLNRIAWSLMKEKR